MCLSLFFFALRRSVQASYPLLPHQSLMYTWDKPSELEMLSWSFSGQKKTIDLPKIEPKVRRCSAYTDCYIPSCNVEYEFQYNNDVGGFRMVMESSLFPKL